MKPKPFASLNHFTVPCSILIVFPGLNCAGGIGATTVRILLGWASTAHARFGSNAGLSVSSLSKFLYQFFPHAGRNPRLCREFVSFWDLLRLLPPLSQSL